MNLPNLISQLFKNRSLLFFISIALLSTVLYFIGNDAMEALRYSRSGVNNGEFWRLISGHFVHSNGWHLVLNLASLMMIGLLFSQHLSPFLWFVCFIFCGLIISACYFWLAPQYGYYVGLSATLYGIIIIGALLDIKEQPLIAVIILVVVTGRVIWQQFGGGLDDLAALIENRVAIESHIFGICSGYGLGLILLLRQHFKNSV